MNLLIHRKKKNMRNFGMQSMGQAPTVADPPPKPPGFMLLAESMHWQFVYNLVPF